MTAKPTPLYKHRLLQDFGPRQREFLLRATTQGVELDDPLATAKSRYDGLTRAQVLEAAGLIHKRTSKKGRQSWRVTDEGRGVVMRHEPRLLMPAARPRRVDSEGSCYTHITAFSMREEPESIDHAA